VKVSEVASAVRTRPPQRLDEPLERRPYDLFVTHVSDLKWIGRKMPTAVEPGGRPIRGCLVEARMISGLLEQVQVSASGVRAYFRPLKGDERDQVFAALTSSRQNEIYYPFTRVRSPLRESVSPPRYWVATPELVSELDGGEAPLRRHAASILRRYGVGGGRIFDPACSTGAFLESIKGAFEGVWTIGQDLSESMLGIARDHVDEVHGGDSICPAVEPESIDVLVLRHLNFNVVTAQRAHELFDATVASVAKGGLVLVLGHTPVLVASPYFEQYGFSVLERHGVTGSGDAAFQFYVLRRLG
jgi:isonocardicin synthase